MPNQTCPTRALDAGVSSAASHPAGRSRLWTEWICFLAPFDLVFSRSHLPAHVHSLVTFAFLAGANEARVGLSVSIQSRGTMVEVNITDATCDFGLAQTDGGECSRSFASYDPDAYLRSQIIYLGIGVVSVSASGFLYWRSVKFDAAKLQQRSLLLSVYVALTLIFRSADPNSYRHVIPHPIVAFFSDSSTAALYSILYVAGLVLIAVVAACLTSDHA